MYTIRETDFGLEFAPVADPIHINVRCDGFSGSVCFDAEDFLIADFALQL